jgi:hypothetical protein
MSETEPNLQLTYEQFLSVLRGWDEYLFIEFSEMPRGYEVLKSIDYACGGYVPPGVDAATIKLSDLAEVIWKTFEAGGQSVDRLHDDYFAERQVEHFKARYSSAEVIASQFEGYMDDPEPPGTMFARLGKKAKMIIIQESLLELAVEIYEQAQNIARHKGEAERVQHRQERAAEKKEAKRRKDIRALDDDRCVFCGIRLKQHFKYIPLTTGSDEPENVVLACHNCEKALGGRTPEDAGMVPLYGRFAGLQVDDSHNH